MHTVGCFVLPFTFCPRTTHGWGKTVSSRVQILFLISGTVRWKQCAEKKENAGDELADAGNLTSLFGGAPTNVRTWKPIRAQSFTAQKPPCWLLIRLIAPVARNFVTMLFHVFLSLLSYTCLAFSRRAYNRLLAYRLLAYLYKSNKSDC